MDESPQERLAYAVLDDDLAELEAAIADGANVNGPMPMTPSTLVIHVAAKRPGTEILRALIDADADVNALTTGFGHVSALYNAAVAGCPDNVSLLIKAGADTGHFISSQGWSSLHGASNFGKTEAVRVLLEEGGMDVNLIAKFNHETPLHLAASWNRCETIELLLDARANIDAGTKGYGFTPLMWSAFRGNTESTELLLARGADPDLRSPHTHQTAQERGLFAGFDLSEVFDKYERKKMVGEVMAAIFFIVHTEPDSAWL